jgi:tetratricopeptide (TPR) repeat protein
MACVLAALCAAGCGTAARTEQPAVTAPPPPRLTAQEREQALANEAETAKDAGDYEAALALFRQILAGNPDSSTAYIGLGEVYLLQEDFASAEPVLARAARLEPRNFDAQYGHGLALQMLERFVEAVKAYHRALTIRPESLEANLHLATTYLQMGEPRSARVFAEKVVQLDPGHGPGRAALGAVYQELGRFEEAVTEYEAAIELMEPTPPLLISLINALGKQKRYVDARNTAEYLVKLVPSAEGYERLGWAEFRLGEYGRSIDAYRRAVEIDGRFWRAHNGIGCNALNAWLLSDQRDRAALQEAKQAFRRSLQANPDQPKVVALLTKYGV